VKGQEGKHCSTYEPSYCAIWRRLGAGGATELYSVTHCTLRGVYGGP
jgi:hypothetical protein